MVYDSNAIHVGFTIFIFQGQEQKQQKDEENRKVIPHFWNLNEDPALAGMIIHFANQGKKTGKLYHISGT